jgi:hypothetical protein
MGRSAPRGFADDCPPQGGWELGWDAMANTGERRTNVGSTNKPKRLTGLDQKVGGQEEGLPHHLPPMSCHRRSGGAERIHGTRTAREKPVPLPPGQASRKASR